MFRSGIDPRDSEAVAAVLPSVKVDISHADGMQQVFLCGEDVSAAVREHIISGYASDVSSHPAVRAFLLGLQRDIAAKSSVVMDGRDIGTVILPDADVKIFLTASDEVRALRRYRELSAKGQDVALEKVRSDMTQRDKNDSTRAAAPAIAAPDAVMLDNSFMTETETLAAAVEIVDKSIKM
jgi:cytidylate kinase